MRGVKARRQFTDQSFDIEWRDVVMRLTTTPAFEPVPTHSRPGAFPRALTIRSCLCPHCAC